MSSKDAWPRPTQRSAVSLSIGVLLLLCACSGGNSGASSVATTPTEAIALPDIELAELTAVLCAQDDKHDLEKRHAATLLGIIRSREALSCLHQVLVSERNASVRAASARALGEIGALESASELENALLDPQREVRVAAALALGNFDTAAAVRALEGLAGGSGPEALAALEALGDYQLMGVSATTAAAGSLILGLALGANALAPGEAAALALIDDLYQAERWGDDAEAERNRRRVRSEIDDAARFMELCR